MNFTIKSLKEISASSVGNILIENGFSIDKSQTWLKKKVMQKNSIKCFFDCYDYKPFKLEYRLVFIFKICEIENEMDKFYNFFGQTFNKAPTFTFSEGDFRPDLKHLEGKYKNAFTHTVTDFDMIHGSIKECCSVLENEIIPVFPIFSDIGCFQEYVLNNYKLIGESKLTMPAIVAMKLKGTGQFEYIANHIWQNLDLESKNEKYYLREFITNFKEFSTLSK
jgi:hypothetical protein